MSPFSHRETAIAETPSTLPKAVPVIRSSFFLNRSMRTAHSGRGARFFRAGVIFPLTWFNVLVITLSLKRDLIWQVSLTPSLRKCETVRPFMACTAGLGRRSLAAARLPCGQWGLRPPSAKVALSSEEEAQPRARYRTIEPLMNFEAEQRSVPEICGWQEAKKVMEQHWITIHVVTDLTGWHAQHVRRLAREG